MTAAVLTSIGDVKLTLRDTVAAVAPCCAQRKIDSIASTEGSGHAGALPSPAAKIASRESSPAGEPATDGSTEDLVSQRVRPWQVDDGSRALGSDAVIRRVITF